MAKADRIVIRLDLGMRAKLNAKASALGLDDAAYARMLIYRDLNGIDEHVEARAPATVAGNAARRVGVAAVSHSAVARERLEELPVEDLVPADEPRAEDMEIAADDDGGVASEALDELLRAGPSLLDEMVATAGAAMETNRAPVAQRGYRNRLSSRDRGLVALGGPGSRTRAVGINDQAVGNNTYGDGQGNVLRDNMRHFGINGTRSR